MDVKGQSAIVTGGGSGLGEATAKMLARKGATVAVFDLNMKGAERVAKEIGGTAIECNVSDPASAEKAFEAARKAVGAARVLVNCAGIGSGELLVKKDGSPSGVDLFQKTIAVNLFGTFNCMRIGAADMSKLAPLADDERGVIVNTASVAAFEGQIGQAAYSASKGGVVGLTLPVARELAAAKVRVVTIAPGLFETPMLAGLPDEAKQSLGAQVPHPARLGRPAEYAALVQHILTNPMLNGEVIRLDGAIRMAAR
jgi:NAD(P)-dependent dehydrogenase (short-subunit alcohol dehydrogenase family)